MMSRRRRTVVTGIYFMVAVLGLCGLTSWAGRKMLFPAPGSRPSAARGHDHITTAEFSTGSEAWLLRPPFRAQGPVPVLLFCHGNGELIDDWVDVFSLPLTWGVAVLLVEYPGYGRSEGSPSEKSITETILQAHDYIRSHDDLDETRVIAYGRSLGGGAVSTLIGRRPVAALVLESTFTSVKDIARSMGVPGFLVLDPFDTRAALRSYSGPSLILHGMTDRVIPHEHGAQLHQAAKNSRFVTMSCGHNDCPRPWGEIHAFLTEQGLVR